MKHVQVNDHEVHVDCYENECRGACERLFEIGPDITLPFYG